MTEAMASIAVIGFIAYNMFIYAMAKLLIKGEPFVGRREPDIPLDIDKIKEKLNG